MVLRDRDIREPLFDFLEETYGKIRILEEHTMGRSRADIVMVTEGDLIGIEIKSDADTYVRLAGQVRDYDKFYDKNIVVVGTSHALHIREHIPEHWGVITVELVEGKADFYVLQAPRENPKVTWKRKLMILWRPELAGIQEHFGMPKYKEKSKEFVLNKIIERVEKGKIDPLRLQEEVCQALFERDYTAVEETLSEYRKGELQKKIEAEPDAARKIELLEEQEARRQQLKSRIAPRKRRRRRRG